ncbi:MAG: hypothetical protein AB1405_18375, partial [Bdellovibrionota bacterium]
MLSPVEYVRKHLALRGLVAALDARAHRKALAKARKATGGKGQVELYFAFDDPYAAVAISPLLEVLAHHRCELSLYPLAEHGIEGDPSEEKRRLHAINDGRRLLKRRNLSLSRSKPLSPRDVLFLAAWTES